jgi:gliding motility-associated-like protein
MKSLVFVLLMLFFQAIAFGQGTFIKTINTANSGRNVRVLQTNDQGIAVFSLDSLKLYKFNSCGNPEWAKQYSIPIGFYPGDIIKTQNGGFALLNRIPFGNVTAFSVTLLDAAGAVVWSISYEDQDFEQYPYTISQDVNGDFVVLSNASPLVMQGYFNSITRLDGNGNLRWTKFYTFGPIWGGAILTSDNGILARIGNTLIKTDNAGNIQWANWFLTSSHHLAAIEVSDGYIFTGYTDSNKISFHKLDRQGNLLWGGRKVLNYTGIPPLLYKKSNGNFVGIFNKTVSGKNYVPVIEFDKDLTVVKQSAVRSTQNGTNLHGWNVGFSDENATILAGTTSSPAGGSSLFFARTDNLFHTGCDTTLAAAITTEPVTHNAASSNVLSHTFQVANKTVPVKTIPATTTTLCGHFTPVQANIHSDSLLCAGSPLQLQDRSGVSFSAYLWSTGETTPTISVNKPGKYWLRATYNCGTQTSSDTVTVSEFVFPQPALTSDTAICGAKPVLINAEIPGATYQWQDGSANPIYYATKPGKYEVDITLGNCSKTFSVQIEDFEKLRMPNVFTPNGDGLNETFAPLEMCGIAAATLKIYNRWGQLLYTTSDIGKGWDGFVNDNKKAAGVYFYLLEYSDFRGNLKRKKGWVELAGN